jgi:hypothetical protein
VETLEPTQRDQTHNPENTPNVEGDTGLFDDILNFVNTFGINSCNKTTGPIVVNRTEITPTYLATQNKSQFP